MYAVSDLWQSILSSDKHHWYEFSVVIGDTGRLITRAGETISFGGVTILISQSGADGGYPDSRIIELSVERNAFKEDFPSVGGCISSQLDLTMVRPAGEIPRMSLVRPYARITNGDDTSEWIPQGVYFIDTRSNTENDDGLKLLSLHAFDAMRMTEQDFPDTTHTWPLVDTGVVQEIADTLGVGVDTRTWDVMTDEYQISAPVGYSMREVLSNIAAMYAGNWVMNYDGELLLVALNTLPPETNYLVESNGFAITFGGDRVLV